MSDELCAYEKQRLENIARNQKVLEALGLVKSDAELHEELRQQGKGAPKKAKRQKGPFMKPRGRRAPKSADGADKVWNAAAGPLGRRGPAKRV